MFGYLLDLSGIFVINPYPTRKSRVRGLEEVKWHLGKDKSTLTWFDRVKTTFLHILKYIGLHRKITNFTFANTHILDSLIKI